MNSAQSEMKPLVAIRCITYNHEPYIRDALEGFVMQKTDFPFVAIVHDDASTDRTADIIREYAAKYPDIIKPIYETENQYSKGDGSMSRMMNDVCVATGAKYIALCEGDDYWTDALKLQKQVDFLESHPDCVYLFADARLHYDDGISEDTYGVESREYSGLDLYTTWMVPTPTVIYRKNVLESECFQKFQKIKKTVFGDLTLAMSAVSIGKVYGMDGVLAVYRRLSTGQTKMLNRLPYRHFMNRKIISDYFGKEYSQIDKQKFALSFLPAIKTFRMNSLDKLRFISRFFIFAPNLCMKEVCLYLKRKV